MKTLRKILLSILYLLFGIIAAVIVSPFIVLLIIIDLPLELVSEVWEK